MQQNSKEFQSINFLDEISNFIFVSKYAKYQESIQRRDTWLEAVTRVESMHLSKYAYISPEYKDRIKKAFDSIRDKKTLPAMRSLQFGGKAIEVKNNRGYNCAVRHIDSIRAFSEVFFLLLCGSGVGLGLSKQYINRLPYLVDASDKTGTVLTYVVEDTIEGWSDSLGALLSCYFRNTPFTGRKIVFDYSKIRRKGTPLKIGGGKAPGHLGLKNSLGKIKILLDNLIENDKISRLRTVDAYDILMHAADAVLSGGIRRAATSVVFDKDDELMLSAKIDQIVDKVYAFTETNSGTFEGKVIFKGVKYEVELDKDALDRLKKEKKIGWFPLFPHRARSNNSVLILRNEVTKAEFKAIIERTRQYGEPGFVFADDARTLFNPCFEIGFIPITVYGESGVQVCNLTTINGRLCNTKENFLEAVENATIIGTCQAGFTYFPYLSKAARELTEDESLLGVSITGIMDNPDILLNPAIQREGAELAKKVNEKWANILGINPAARITCIKPEGTSSLVLGTGSGIHPHHSRRYFRRVQCNKLDNVYKFFKKHNPHMCESSVWSTNKTDDIITFPIEVSTNVKTKADLTALEHLKVIKSTQQNWVIPGSKTKYNKKNIAHNVSCTVIVNDNEWDSVISYIFDNREYFTAVSLLPATGDKKFPQAPMEDVVTEEDREKWNNITNNFKHVDYTKLQENDDKTCMTQEVTCAGGACQVVYV